MPFEAATPDEHGENSTSVPMGQKLNESVQTLGEKNKMSLTNIRRYIRLTKLTSELLDLVDDGDIPFRAGEDLSYIPAKGQQLISDLLGTTEYKVDLKKAGKLKEYAQAGRLNEDSARLILSGAIFDAPVKKMTAVKVPYKKLSSMYRPIWPSRN